MPTRPTAHDLRVSDLVIESKIEATWDPATEQTTHIRTAVGVSARRRRLKTEETWKRKRILGRGAYGTVWLEERIASSGPSHGDSSLRAIKEIRKRADVSAYEFHRELEAMAKFSHERFMHCFVRSLGWFESEESLFITMEYLKHGDLQQYLTKPFPEPEAKQIALQIAEALQLMHESGFAHRDLKPGNILVLQKGPAWWVKIADFGISKRVEASTILRTMEIGTRGFMAPEILGLYCPDDFDDEDLDADDETDDAEADALAYTPAIDLWALGEITHRMLTQKPVFAANKRLWSYVTKGTPFPTTELQSAGTSAQGIEFIQKVMTASAKRRLTAENAIKHKWLDGHEFIDEARSRSSTESIRELGPTGLTILDDEPSAQWTATEQYSEPLEAFSTESIPDAADQEEITEETIEASAKPLTTTSEERVPETELETLKLHDKSSETTKINNADTIVKVAEIPIPPQDPKLARSPSPEIPLRQEPPVSSGQQNTVDAHDWDTLFASIEDATPAAPINNEPERSLSPQTPLRQEPSARTSQPNVGEHDDWNAVFSSAENTTDTTTSLPQNTANKAFNYNTEGTNQPSPHDWDAIFAQIDDAPVATPPVNSQPVRFSSPEVPFFHEPPAHVGTDFTSEATLLPQESSDNQSPALRKSYSWEGRPVVLPPDTNSETTVTPQRPERLDVRFNRPADDAPMTNKRDLKTWWKSFRVASNSKAQEDPARGGIFGVPLRQSITYANVAISLMDNDGNTYVYGYVPIVIAKCGVFLKEKGTDVKKIFAQSGSARRIRELRTIFETPDRYGKGIAWDGYTVHDAANVFRRYLNDLPEPVVPLDLYHRFCDPLRGATKEAVGDTVLPQTIRYFNQAEAITEYQGLFIELPPLNRQLLLYVLDLLAVFASKSDDNGMPAQTLASLFQRSIISHPELTEERRLNECILIFLIENQDHFLIGM